MKAGLDESRRSLHRKLLRQLQSYNKYNDLLIFHNKAERSSSHFRASQQTDTYRLLQVVTHRTDFTLALWTKSQQVLSDVWENHIASVGDDTGDCRDDLQSHK